VGRQGDREGQGGRASAAQQLRNHALVTAFGGGMVPVRIKPAPSKLRAVLVFCVVVALSIAGSVLVGVARGTPEPTPLPLPPGLNGPGMR